MRELPEIGSYPAGLTGDEKAILLHEFCEMLSAFAWPFIREANGPAGIADRGCSITYTLLNPEQWPKNVVHVLMDGREHSLHGFKMEEHYFDDLKVGDRFKSEPLNVTEKQVIEFAHEFDPQMFHLSRKAAERTIFKGLIASGWHTAAMSMRLLVQTLNFAEGAIGLGVDELRWPNVVRPGDVLTLETEIVDRRPSRSKPKYGIIRLRNVTKNQRGEIVQTMLASAMLPRRRA